MPIIVTPDPAITQLEGFVLDGLDLNDGLNFWALQLDGPPAPLRQRWIESDDSDGDVLAERSRRGNRTWTVSLFVAPQASTDAFLAKIGQIQDKLYEAEQQADQGGLEGTWTPAGGSNGGTLRVLSGEITGLPITVEDGWFSRAPKIQLRLDCFPFLIGEEVTAAATVTNSNPYQILTVAGVTGDVPAEARLAVTNSAASARRFLRWGRRWRYYDAAASLYIDSDSMVTSGFSGSQTTRTGAHDPNATGNSVIRGTLSTIPLAICGLGSLGHVGNYLPVLRCYAAPLSASVASDFKVRLTWREGDGPPRSNAWVSPAVVGNWSEVELGNIAIPPKTLGTQRWTGQIEAYSAVIGDTLDVDYSLLYPTDGYGKARAPLTRGAPTAVTAYDNFTGTTAGNALNARVAPVGGTWATSGTATDFTFADAPSATEETITRATTTDVDPGRFAILGSTNYTDVEVAVRFRTTGVAGTAPDLGAVVARYVDGSNFLRVTLKPFASGAWLLGLAPIIGGIGADAASTLMSPLAINTWYRLRLAAYASGYTVATVLSDSDSELAEVIGVFSTLATGGTLATGKVGIRDNNTASPATTRYYDDFYVATPSTEPIVTYPGRSTEINSQKAERADATGTYYGPVPSYRGARFFLEPAGDENRTNEVIVSAKRNDIEVAADDQIGDLTTVTIHYTPRWSTVPR